MEKLVHLDATVYQPQYLVDQEITRKRLEPNPYTDICIKHGADLVGYVTLLPIPAEIAGKIKRGTSNEAQTEGNVLPYRKMGRYQAYLSSIVVNKRKYPAIRAKHLFQLLQEHLRQMRKRGFFIDVIYAIAASIAGRKTLQRMKFAEVGPNIFVYSTRKQGMEWIAGKPQYALAEVLVAPMALRNRSQMPSDFASMSITEWYWDTDT
ncbi:hypothetical protein ACI7RC_01220 [Brevibacillus sp. B_LB10_24]|uniref:hypothetical protein n=1 Tax=Brevibacillus sp. B_LB10_24 TaxID=3380645 RepID=UPI0038BB7FAE